jgi:hypothetical protein
MSYHDLSECTLSADERRIEADRILEMFGIGALDTNDCSQTERDFIFQLGDGRPVSVKQLFWLRDIKDRVL